MKKRISYFAAVFSIVCLSLLCTVPAFGEDLLIKSCSELVRLAENYQTDLKTVDTVLGSAIDHGNMDRIRNYKLRKAVIKQQLEGVMQAVSMKGCAKVQ